MVGLGRRCRRAFAAVAAIGYRRNDDKNNGSQAKKFGVAASAVGARLCGRLARRCRPIPAAASADGNARLGQSPGNMNVRPAA